MIDKQINRLRYTLGNNNKPNETDIDALNGIIDYVNNEKQRQLNNHHLFAKLFINTFKNELIKSEGNYIKSSKSLLEVFKIDLESHYKGFYNEINEIEFKKCCDVLGISLKHPRNRTKEDNQRDKELIKEYKEELSKHLKYFSKKKVYNRLNELLTNLVEDYG